MEKTYSKKVKPLKLFLNNKNRYAYNNMLKPLVRTIPNLSGNVKLACTLASFKKYSYDLYECFVRYARMLPISSSLAQKQYEINLLNSAYEFDLKRFYNGYSSTFYSSAFDYSKDLYSDADISSELYNRDKDFEFGVKRVSYVKNGGSQFAFFAPIWIESADDIPDYFLMNIKIDNSKYSVTKQLKIWINDKKKEHKKNYLSVYLNKYAKNLNSNVIFCQPSNNQATYFGIDIVKGGFVKKTDNIIAKNYRFQASIDKFDLNITEGFKRNKICISQILPLAFYFSLDDIMDANEVNNYAGAKTYIEGAYWKDEKKCKMYDFSTDYTSLRQNSWLYKNRKFKNIDTGFNLMDMPFPSLKEASYPGYEHFNKITKEAVRWKMKHSSDEYPYIINMSPAFSNAQQSHMKYREYPETFSSISVLNDTKNNIMSPLYENALKDENSFYLKDARALKRYSAILQNNATTWFNVADFTEWYEKHTVNNTADVYDKTSWYKKIPKEEVESYINVSKTSDIANLNESLFDNIVIDNISETPDLYAKCSSDELAEYWSYLNYRENEHIEYDEIADSYSMSQPYSYREPYSVDLYERHSIFDNPDNWAPVTGHKAFFKGILYDFTQIWRDNPGIPKIDKFGVFVKPMMTKLPLAKLNELISAKWTLIDDKKLLGNPNCVISTHLRTALSTEGFDYKSMLYMNELGYGMKTSRTSHDSLFFMNKDNTDGQFISLADLGYNLWETNKYFEVNDLIKKFRDLEYKIEVYRNKYVIQGYKFLPIYRLSQVSKSGMIWFEKYKMGKTKWLMESLYFNTRENHNKVKYEKDTIAKFVGNSGKYILEVPLMLRKDFISVHDLMEILVDENGI